MMGSGVRRWLMALLLRHAANRLRGRYPDWSDAMANEAALLTTDNERLRWAAGCAAASYRAPGGFDWIGYPAALMAGMVMMSVYQWSVDEGPGTLAVLSVTGLALGFFRPDRVLASGLAVGAVVTAVNAFEALSGIRPAYEVTPHSLLHSARWFILLAPALIASAAGGYAGRRLAGRSA